MMRAGSAAGSPPPPATIYSTQVEASPGASPQSGLTLTLGFHWDPSGQIPIPDVGLGGQDVTPQSALSVDDDGCLVIAMDLTSVSSLVCAMLPGSYLVCSAVIAQDGSRFSGAIKQTCSGSVTWTWTGAAAPGDEHALRVASVLTLTVRMASA